jgi:hypothetical protein
LLSDLLARDKCLPLGGRRKVCSGRARELLGRELLGCLGEIVAAGVDIFMNLNENRESDWLRSTSKQSGEAAYFRYVGQEETDELSLIAMHNLASFM